jgi:acetyl esterase/lipase
MYDSTIDRDCHYDYFACYEFYTGQGSNSSLPVMVWIHGGAFLTSEGRQLPGERLAAVGKVVVVTMNFRFEHNNSKTFLGHGIMDLAGFEF